MKTSKQNISIPAGRLLRFIEGKWSVLSGKAATQGAVARARC